MRRLLRDTQRATEQKLKDQSVQLHGEMRGLHESFIKERLGLQKQVCFTLVPCPYLIRSQIRELEAELDATRRKIAL